jgi:hypothetical protein
MKIKLRPLVIIYSQITIFIILLAHFVTPYSSTIKGQVFPLVAILGLLFLLLGIILIVITKNEKGKYKLFLMITGLSAIAPLIFSILHNVFYGLAIRFENLSILFNILHSIFFIIAIMVAPIFFIIGAITSIIISKKISPDSIN